MDHPRHALVTSSAGLALRSFSTVDAAPDADALVAALDEQATSPAIQRLRVAATELLAPRFGQRLVDVGCGTGEVTRALGVIVGPHGTVVGIEPSETMLLEARRRLRGGPRSVEFRPGDITRLDLHDASFDGAYCERVLQHVDAPQEAAAELVRVTKPGGRIVVVDTDWGMHAIHGADPRLTSRVIESWAGNAANGWSGRRLPALFVDAGVREPVIVAETFITTDGHRPRLPPITTMAAVARDTGALGADEAEAWLEQLVDAGWRGRFLWAVTMFAVAGTRQ